MTGPLALEDLDNSELAKESEHVNTITILDKPSTDLPPEKTLSNTNVSPEQRASLPALPTVKGLSVDRQIITERLVEPDEPQSKPVESEIPDSLSPAGDRPATVEPISREILIERVISPVELPVLPEREEKRHNSLPASTSQSARSRPMSEPVKPQIIVKQPESPKEVDSPASQPLLAQSSIKQPTSTIQVTIGRVEVRAISSNPLPKKRRSAPPVMSLDEYLHRRSQGGKR